MEVNFYDSELIRILETHIKREDIQTIDAAIYYEEINSKIPFTGGRIDFSYLSEYRKISFIEGEFEKILTFMIEVEAITKTKPTDKIIYLGDSLTHTTYIFPFKYLKEVILEILSNIPQHHYFLWEDMRWVMFVSFEGCIEMARISDSLLKS